MTSAEIAERNALVEQYLWLVRAVICKSRLPLPTGVSYGDVYNEGAIGLIDAAERFAAARGVDFKTYAWYRIKGAIYDALREFDPLGRETRRYYALCENVRSDLAVKLDRMPTDAEVASAAKIGEPTLRRTYRAVGERDAVELDRVFHNGTQRVRFSDLLASSDRPALDVIVADETQADLRAAIWLLPVRERRVMHAHLEGVPMATTCVELGVCESRVSQIKKDAIARLRSMMAA